MTRPTMPKAEPAAVTQALDAVALLNMRLPDLERTLACAESCTGGLIAKLITDLPGVSSWFQGSAVTYSNEAKRSLLGVKKTTLDQHGAVSEQCAKEMAAGAYKKFGASYGIATTGIAGPGGGAPGKPVGTIWVALAVTDDPAQATAYKLPNLPPRTDRDTARYLTVNFILRQLLKVLG